ncbi:MAG TPA: ATP-grasp domain-containing protein, partial [candidate division WOR-3 bacterium]|nr:ATP-grasp domain-containing protein [candidate division WOR-3 bacterium]
MIKMRSPGSGKPPAGEDRPHVLLTCAGRRNYLIGQFRAALGGRGRVFATDCRADAAALAEADAGFVLPPADDEEYPGRLLALCREQRVGLVVPLNDLELPVLARNRERFRATGVRLLVSTPEVIELCFDKLATDRQLHRWGFVTPLTFADLGEALHALDRGRLALPLVVKPRHGSGSVGVEVCRDRRELVLAHQLLARRLARAGTDQPEGTVLVQEFIAGAEYGLDIVNDLSGRNVSVFVKRKLAMRAGETDRAETLINEDLLRVGRELGTRLGHVGNLDCDAFLCRRDVVVMELNPR